VGPGESVGVIGVNGAGKSTLLRLGAGLTRATRGRVSVPGETAAVLTLGDTFNLELTGSENLVTASVIAGMSRAEARARVPAMLEFGELEAFADAPVRTYSDGMRLRLAFSVVAQLRPAALLLDEVMAVGDLRFQERCLQHVRGLREGGTSFVFSSHSLDDVAAECDRALWLQAGGVRALGDAAEVVEEYRDAMRSETLERTPAPTGHEPGGLELRRNRFGTQELTVEHAQLRGRNEQVTAEIATGDPLTVCFELHPHSRELEDPVAGVTIHRLSDGVVCLDASTEGSGVRVGPVTGGRVVSLRFERLDLVPGDYAVDVGAYRPDWAYAYDYHWQAYPLRVVGQGGGGVLRAPARWTAGPLTD
jgi:lipopolysaccharide transport system ATP-binding protein